MAQFPTLWSNHDRNHPFRAMTRLQQQIDRMFNDALSGSWTVDVPLVADSVFQPPCDVQETDTHYVYSFDLPGMSKRNVNVEIRDGALVVTGERKEEHQEGKGANLRTERYQGAIERMIALPTNVKPDAVEAQFADGVLHVAVAKAEASRPRKIEIAEGKPGFIGKLLGKKDEKAA